MKKHRTIWLFVLAVIVTPVAVYGVVQWLEGQFSPLPYLGPDNHVIGDFKFVDQRNKIISLADWKGKIIVAHFFFTHCPAVCPKMIGQLKRVQAYANQDIAIYSLSVDPENDSVGQLRKYANRSGINHNWYLLTGDKKTLYRFARKDLMIVATDGDGGPEDFIHSDNVVLIDQQQRIRGYYKGTDEQEMNLLIHDIDKLKAP